MQSLASLMSLKQSDIGNLDDFNDSDEEEGERRVSIGAGMGPATPVTGRGLETNDKSFSSRIPGSSQDGEECV